VVVSRFALGEPDHEINTTSRVEDVVRAIIEAGGHYPDVVQFLHAAKVQGALASRFEVEAVPQAGRQYDRPKQDGDAKSESTNFEVLGPLPNLFGRRGGDVESGDSTADRTADGSSSEVE
jgi:hypothetical protein